MKATPIIPGKLYQGANLNKLTPEQRFTFLRNIGANAVVGMWGDKLNLSEYGFSYFHSPIADGKVKDQQRLLEIAKDVSEIIGKGGCAYVYCHAGRNRSGFMNALIYRFLYGCSGKEALEKVREMRPRAIDNEHFEKFLLDLPVLRAL